jgi:hypothetical protein
MSFLFFFILNFLRPHNSLESLLRNLCLCGGNRLLSIRIFETTSLFTILQGRSFGGAYALSLSVICAASRGAVCVAYTAASDELSGIAFPDILGACIVGGNESSCTERDYNIIVS